MFDAARWARAFIAVSGGDAGDTLICLKALAAPIKSVRGVFFGSNGSVRIEKILREITDTGGEAENSPAVEYAIRFICLLVEKHSFRYIDLIVSRIESILNEKQGILDVTIEAASSVDASADAGFEENLRQMIKERTGAAEVKINTRIKPDLLGGYLLRTEGFYVDASLKGQLEKMKAALISDGGSNG